MHVPGVLGRFATAVLVASVVALGAAGVWWGTTRVENPSSVPAAQRDAAPAVDVYGAHRAPGPRVPAPQAAAEAEETAGVGPATDAPTVDPAHAPARGAIHGRALDDARRPVRGALVVHASPRRGKPRPGNRCEVGPGGEFSVRSPLDSADRIRVLVACTGYVTSRRPDVVVGAAGDVDLGTVRLVRALPLGGRVIDERGTPVEGAPLTVVPDADEAPEEWAEAGGHRMDSHEESRDDGSFTFACLPRGRWRVRCDAPGAPPDVVAETGDTRVTLVLPRALAPRDVRVRVRALDPQGAPLACFSAELWVRDEKYGWEETQSGEASVNWHCRYGPVRLVVRDPRTLCQAVFEDVVSRDEPYVARLAPAHVVRGRILPDPAVCEEPLSWDIWATLLGRGDSQDRFVRGASAEAGSFVISVPAPGTWRIESSHQRAAGLSGTALAAADGPPVVVHALPEETIHVRVALPAGEQVVESGREFDVHAVSVDPADGQEEWGFVAAPGGVDVIGLPAGRTWRVAIRAETASGWTAPAVLEGVRPGPDPVEVRLMPGLAIDGVVVRRDGTPVEGATVTAMRDGDGWTPRSETGIDGHFRLTGLTSGAWRVAAETWGLASRGPAAVAAGSGDVVVIALPRLR